MSLYDLQQQPTLNSRSPLLKDSSRRGLRRSPRSPPTSPHKTRLRLGDGSPAISPAAQLNFGSPAVSLAELLDFGSPHEESSAGRLDFGSTLKRWSPMSSPSKGSPCKRSPNKRGSPAISPAAQLNFGSPAVSLAELLDFGSPHEESSAGRLDFGSTLKRWSPMSSPSKGSPCKRSPNKRWSPSGSPKKRLSPSKKHHTLYLGGGAFTPKVEKLEEGNGTTVKKVVFVYPLQGIKPIDKRRFKLANPTIRPISYEDWLKIKESHERTGVPNVVRTFPVTEIPDNGVLKCEICMECVRTLFEVLPTLTLKDRLLLSRKLWKALSEINAYLAKEGLCLNDPALNWGLDEDGNVKFYDLLFSKKMTIASGFKFGYEGKTMLSVDDERKIVQLRAFVLMLMLVEQFQETSCRLEFENFVRKLYVENKVGELSIADLEAFLSSRL